MACNNRTSFIIIDMICFDNMKTTFKVTKTYGILSAVFIITLITMLGSQLVLHQALSQGQAINATGNNGNSTASTTNQSNPSPISIPLSKGYVNGKIAYFIATDASDSQIAASITNTTGFKVNYAPNLASTPESALQPGYVFVNGIKTTESPVGFQLGVSSALPGEKGYSPLSQLNYVKWNANATPRILKSAAEIIDAQKNGELSIAKTNIVINSPAVPVVNNMSSK
jgi:hypothetical protein